MLWKQNYSHLLESFFLEGKTVDLLLAKEKKASHATEVFIMLIIY